MKKSIQEIWIDLHQELEKFIRSKVKDEDAVKDIIQDVFLKIHQNIHTLSDCHKLTSWVFQITRNTITDYFRSLKTSISIEIIDIAEQESDEPIYQSLSHCINLKINALPDKYKQAVLLTSFQHYSQLELASALGISYSGAKSRVQRAKEKLKTLILDCDNVETDERMNIIDYHLVQK